MGFLDKLIPDNLWFGLVVGFLFPFLPFYFLLGTVDPDLVKYSKSYLENVALLCIFINAALMMGAFTGMEKDKTGKGLLTATFIYVVIYMIYFYVL